MNAIIHDIAETHLKLLNSESKRIDVYLNGHVLKLYES